MISRPFLRKWTHVLDNQVPPKDASPDWKKTRADERDAEGNPLPGATVFELAHLSAKVEEEVTHLQGHGQSMAGMRLTLLYGLAGWRNLHDEKGEPVEFKAGTHPRRCDESNLEHLPFDVRAELAGKIYAGAKVSAPEGD